MKPSVNKILTQLSKKQVELAAEKVELAIVDDVANMVQTSQATVRRLKRLLELQEKNDQDLINAIKKVVSDGDKRASKLDAEIKQLERAENEIANVLERAEKAAGELGIDENAIKGYSTLDKLYNQVETAYKEATSFVYSDLAQYAR